MSYSNSNNSACFFQSPFYIWEKHWQRIDDEFQLNENIRILEDTNLQIQIREAKTDDPIRLNLHEQSIYDQLTTSSQHHLNEDEWKPEYQSSQKQLRFSDRSQNHIEEENKPKQARGIKDKEQRQRTKRRVDYGVGDSFSNDSDLKPCHCSKTKCLQLYCSCFHKNKACSSKCQCKGCFNDGNHKVEMVKALQKVKLKEYRVSQSDLDSFDTRQVLGCKCKKTHCKKGYCECFIRGRKCTSQCKCCECNNQRQKSQVKKRIKKN
ncbi:unnamed protein product (macronuclear) [Paramecium tetraurelia]|uniref:CRC domain-containing protein n=1 Tax=Paramecium tetraurelia TaxID=5888 RepID=A0DLC6_PARTE|nr:uncharacterized protein GSPATT00018160001 [Paramecium tetraurelia]CAK83843.1 unnamed protein product [Paramecium tetraurelia]|eukprot:XP_001451240.1 hypothetical protein (macronuclear) [Paramecium tetraurelia strain d4-2]